MIPSWVLNPNSTTERFRKLTSDFEVHVLFNGKTEAKPLESARFGLTSSIFAREVILSGNNQKWMLARSLCPLNAAEKPILSFLEELNTTSLGTLLKAHQAIRGPIMAEKIMLNEASLQARFTNPPHIISGIPTVFESASRRQGFHNRSLQLVNEDCENRSQHPCRFKDEGYWERWSRFDIPSMGQLFLTEIFLPDFPVEAFQ